MAAGKKSKDLINQVLNNEADNNEQPNEIYLAQKTIQHSGKVFKAGDVVEVASEDLQRLIKLGAVKLQDDGFPRIN